MSSPTAAYVDTPEKIERIRQLWEAKAPNGKPLHSTGEIGRMLGISKNSVVSWVGRKGKPVHGFSNREAATWKGKKRDANAPPPPSAPRPRVGAQTLPPLASIAVAEEPPPPLPVSETECAFLHGDGDRPRDWKQCENKAVVGLPYCESCASVAYVSFRKRGRDGDRPGA